MKEHPIIFSSEMVKAILDSKKSMTRRMINLKGYSPEIWDKCTPHNSGSYELLGEPYLKVPYDSLTDNAGIRITCPYGQVGDRLWVKETWATENQYNHLKPSKLPLSAKIWYLADRGYNPQIMGRVHSPRFMPRWASRILLEITKIRAERLQEITGKDAFAEGCKNQVLSNFERNFDIVPNTAREKFAELWDFLNAKRGFSFESNPWVWCISFKRSEP